MPPWFWHSRPAVSAQVPFVQQAPNPQGLGEQVVPVIMNEKPLGQVLVPSTTLHSPVPELLQHAPEQGVGEQDENPGR